MNSCEIKELVQHISAHELSLAKMYNQFARAYPNHKEFWSKLAHEEMIHSKWIKSLENHFDAGQIGLSGFKLNHRALKTSISHLEKQILATKNGNLSLLNAVAVAVDIEKSMIDNKFFAIFDLKDKKFNRIRTGLEKETKMHRQKLEKLFLKLKEN